MTVIVQRPSHRNILIGGFAPMYQHPRAIVGVTPFDFDSGLVTFTPGMAKRTAPGPFATGPIVQGELGGVAGKGDTISFTRGTPISGEFYPVQDSYQGALSFWITPEWDGNDGESHTIFGQYGGGLWVHKSNTNVLQLYNGVVVLVTANVSGWTAGTTYNVITRWDSKNPIDGTNYACISINDSHTFGRSGAFTADKPNSTMYVGRYTGSYQWSADALIEGVALYRRVLFDGTYGVDVGNGDEIAQIYNAGAGQDPTLITGSWDVTFCLPTDSSAGALTTGEGEAWSHPHSSAVLDETFYQAGMGPDQANVVEFDGANTIINCGSNVSLDDLHDHAFTAEAWVRINSDGNGGVIFNKRDGSKGWWLRVTAAQGLWAYVYCATTNSQSRYTAVSLYDSKWHHVRMQFDDAGDRKIYLWIDGRAASYSTQIAGVGSILSDAPGAFTMGDYQPPGTVLDGAMGWARLSDTLRATAGVDFIPPRAMPTKDGNTVEQWSMDEGTGTTITADVSSPTNDGTLSNGTWGQTWEDQGSPLVPYSVEFNGSTTSVNCGSAADVDDLPSSGDMTVEGWIRWDALGDSSWKLLASKGGTFGSVGGWGILHQSSELKFKVNYDSADANAYAAITPMVGAWCHVAGTWANGTKTATLWVNGVSKASDAATGSYVADAANDLVLGNLLDGGMGWFRLSDSIRYTDTFIPPSRLNPPAVDGNTVRQFNFRDGAGSTLTDETGTADGTISNGTWNTTRALDTDAPGQRVFNWGITVGNDAANEGAKQTLAGLSAGQNYVARIPLQYERDRQAWPRIRVYDETNGATIVDFDGPRLVDVHTGANNAATLTNSNGHFTQGLVGGTVYNITDGSSGTITAATQTTVTATLSGGTDDDWDTSDEYMIVPPNEDEWVWCEPFCWEVPTVARNGVAASCTSMSVQLLNANTEGAFYVHQAEVQVNLFDNPSLETGSVGDPATWIPDGWTRKGIDAGESEQELTIVHSGSSSMQFNSGATSNEGCYDVVSIHDIGDYLAWGGWGHTACGYGMTLNPERLRFQASNSNFVLNTSDAVWKHTAGVGRATAGLFYPGPTGKAAVGYRDDIYIFILDPVSLTVTPASEANSAETSGLRVDGLDTCTQPME